jgi:hypothetical protein
VEFVSPCATEARGEVDDDALAGVELAEAELVIEIEDDEELGAGPADPVGERHALQGSCRELAGAMRRRGGGWIDE